MTRIIIAEDHAMVRQGIVSLLERESSLTILAQAHDGLQAVEKVRQLRPDVLLLDLTLPRLHGFDVLSVLRTQKTTRCVVLTIHTDRVSILESFRLGAKAFVPKESPITDLICAIHEVARGGWWASPEHEPMLRDTVLTSHFQKREREPAPNLTRREQIVLHAVAEGKTNANVAQELGISLRTVEKHRGNAMRRLGLRNEAEVVRYAVRHRLICL